MSSVFLEIKNMNNNINNYDHVSTCCGKSKWLKLVLGIILILSLSGIVVISILRDKIVNNYPNQVSVNGQGKVSYQPDTANITIGVQIDKIENAEEALKMLNEKVNKIITALTALGIQSKDIKNQNYSLYPFYDYIEGVNTLNGYNANQQIVIKVTGIDKNFNILNQVVSESAKAGANQVLGVSFETSQIEELKQEARILAIADAKKKAETLSGAIGISLDEIVGWWENIISPSPYYDYSSYGGMGGGGNPVINSGSHEVSVELTLNYKLKKNNKIYDRGF